MKKMILVLAAMLMAVPAMAGVTISGAQVGDSNTAVLSYAWDGVGSRPRAFALNVDVVVGSAVIKAVTPTVVGECNSTKKGYGIFMGGINIANDGTVNGWGTPVGDTADAAFPATRTGLDSNGVTIEMGSLYVGDANKPGNSGDLCVITVSNWCTVRVQSNAIRGKVVLEDATSVDFTPFDIVIDEPVTDVPVPNVVNMSQAAATTTITGAGLVVGTVTQQVDNTKTPGTVISSDPVATTMVPLGSAVNLVVSKYCFPSTYTTYPDFTTYIANGWTPEIFSWCNPYQCYGDADGITEGLSKYRVYSKDLDILLANWKKKMGNRATGADPRADFDHKSEGLSKYRCYSKDLDILLANWKKKDTNFTVLCPKPE